jgi:hypothetical protein
MMIFTLKSMRTHGGFGVLGFYLKFLNISVLTTVLFNPSAQLVNLGANLFLMHDHDILTAVNGKIPIGHFLSLGFNFTNRRSVGGVNHPLLIYHGMPGFAQDACYFFSTLASIADKR